MKTPLSIVLLTCILFSTRAQSQAVQCQVPASIVAGTTNPSTVLGTTISIGSTFILTCNTGYLINGISHSPYLIFCKADGSLSVEPECKLVQCQVPSSYDNGEITPSDSNSVVGAYYYEETFTLTCNSGYNLGSPDKTSVVISCQADGSLSEPNAECKQVTCATDTEEIPYANKAPDYVTINGDENVIYTCHLGYKFSFESIGPCYMSGEAGGSTFCSMWKCTVTVDTLETKEVHTCTRGYDFQDITSIYRYCNNDGSLRGDILDCSPVQCDVLSPIANGVIEPSTVGSTINYEETFTVTCNNGYNLGSPDFQTTIVISCQADGSLSVANLECKPVQCDVLSRITNGVIEPSTVGSTINYEETFTVTCNNGYNLGSPDFQTTIVISCQADGSLSVANPECKPIQCDVLSPIANGVIEPSTVGSTINYEETFTVTCNNGYNLGSPDFQTTIVISCQADGSLSVANLECKPVQCDVLSPIANGVIEPSTVGSTINYEETFTVTCNNGYNLGSPDFQTTIVISCQADGSLSVANPECKPVQCDVLSPIANGVIEPSTVGSTINYEETFTVTCNNGYNLGSPDFQTTIVISCQADGSLSVANPECKPVQCDVLSPIANGVIGPSTVGSTINYEETFTVTCNNGYNLGSPDFQTTIVISCQADGSLSVANPECKPVQCDVLSPITNGVIEPSTVGSTINYEETFTVTCNNGYNLGSPDFQTTIVISCQADGSLSVANLECKPVQCDVLSPITNGVIEPSTVGSTINYEETFTVSCNNGYILGSPDFQTTIVISCQADGSLSVANLECKPVQCDVLSPITNGVIEPSTVGSTINNEETFTVTCNNGYNLGSPDFQTTIVISCQADGSLSVANLECKPVQCDVLSPITNGVIEPSTVGSTINYEETFTVTCNNGYNLGSPDFQTTIVISCQADGYMSVANPECKPIQCDVLSPIANGVIEPSTVGSTINYEETFTVTCNNGYNLGSPDFQTTIVISCQADGSLSVANLECKPVQCDVLSPIANGVIETSTVGSTINYEETFTVTCNNGHNLGSPDFQTTIVISCQADGSLSVANPECKPVQCDVLSPIANGVIEPSTVGSTINYEETFTVTCNNGYNLGSPDFQTTIVISCQADGSLSETNPECKPVQCDVLSPIANGVIEPSTVGSTINYEETFTVTCNNGYNLGSPDFQTTIVISCQADGSLSVANPECKPVQCDVLSPITNGVIEPSTVGSTINYEGTFTVTCNNGYNLGSPDFQTTIVISCQADRSLSVANLECKPVQCDVLSPITNGVIEPSTVGSTINYEETFTVTCNNGYNLGSPDFQTTIVISCQADGSLSVANLECKPVQCDVLSPIANGVIEPSTVGSTINYEETFTVTCNNGYNLGSPDFQTTIVISCQADGSLSVANPECKPIKCDVLSSIANGVIEPSTVGSAINYEETFTVTCNNGYNLGSPDFQTTIVISCQADGSLSVANPECKPVQCDVLSSITNGVIEPSIVGSTINYEETFTVTCNNGYNLGSPDFQTTIVISCQADGSLSVANLECKPVQCDVLSSIANGVIEPSTVGSTINYEETFTVTCNNGYNLGSPDFQTAIVISCQADGSLSVANIECKPVQCDVLSRITNGVIEPSTVGSTINYEETFTVTCNNGYNLGSPDFQTTMVISCQADGSLSVANPECKPIQCDVLSPIAIGVIEPSTVGSTINYEETFTVTCNNGYNLGSPDFQTTIVISCQADGSLSVANLECKPVQCDVLSPIANGVIEPSTVGSTINYEETFTVTCNNGYNLGSPDFQTTIVISCQADGSLSVANPECKPSTINYEETFTVTCNNGYNLGSPDFQTTIVISCQADGSLSTANPECKPVQCDVLSPITNGVIEPSTVGSTINYEETFTVTCNNGYNLGSPDFQTTIVISCQADGSLSVANPECKPVTCPIEEVDNAEIYPDNQDHINFDTSAIYVCNNGYVKTEGDTIRKCLANEQLSGEPLICSIVKCRAAVCGVTSNPSDEYVNFDTEVVYTCEEGYHMSGDEKQKCQADGTMHGNGPVCSTVTCETPTVPNASKPNKDEIHFLETIVYKCDLGFELTDGDLTRTCESSGELSGETPKCSDTDECATDPTPCKNGKCKNSEGTFSCDCTGTGYIGTLCQHKSSKFIEERPSGLLNILITAPYGGDNMLASITPVVSDRHDGCYDAGTDKCMYYVGCAPQDAVHCGIKNAQEIYSEEIALKLYQKIYARTGYHPKLLLNKVHPSKLDVDVGREEGTFNQDLSAAIYDDYHAKLASAIESFSGPGLVITVRTYNIDGEIVISLGYMLTADELNINDEAGLEGLIGSSSMQHLPAGVSFNDLIRGDESLGARMEDRGLTAVPSPANPGPGTGLYFSNKNSYIAKTHRDVINVLGLYIPLFRDGVDDDQDCGAGGSCVPRRNIRKVARAILEYYKQHYEVNYCEPNPCENDGVCDNLADGFHCECTKKWRGKRCQTVNRLRTRRMGLKVKFLIEVPEDLNDPDNYLEVKTLALLQFKAKLFKRFKRLGNMRKILISRIWKGSLNVELDIDIDETPESLIDATVSVNGLGQDTFIFFDIETTPSNISLDGVYVSTSPSAENTCRLYTAVIGGECPGGGACVVENSIPKCQEDETDDLKHVFTSVMAGVLVALVLILATAIVFATVLKYKTNKGQKVLPLEGPTSAVHATEKIYN